MPKPVSLKNKKSSKKIAGLGVGPTPTLRSKPGKMVYYFGKTKTEGEANMKVLLGGKGANLADMTSIGLPVPPASPSPPTPAPRTTRPACVCPTAS